MRTCKGSWRSVRLIEATMVSVYEEEALPRSFWMISAGRVPCCSAPRPGDQLTSQISPRRGLGTTGGLGDVEEVNVAFASLLIYVLSYNFNILTRACLLDRQKRRSERLQG